MYIDRQLCRKLIRDIHVGTLILCCDLCPVTPVLRTCRSQEGLKNTPQANLLMSTFEGRQITQLICRKPVGPEDASITSTPHPNTEVNVDTSTAATGSSSQGEEEEAEGGTGGEKKGERKEERDESSSDFDTRERGEAFMCISLEVKNMLGVEDALEKFTEKEIIEGYAWDEEVGDVMLASFWCTLAVVLVHLGSHFDVFRCRFGVHWQSFWCTSASFWCMLAVILVYFSVVLVHFGVFLVLFFVAWCFSHRSGGCKCNIPPWSDPSCSGTSGGCTRGRHGCLTQCVFP